MKSCSQVSLSNAAMLVAFLICGLLPPAIASGADKFWIRKGNGAAVQPIAKAKKKKRATPKLLTKIKKSADNDPVPSTERMLGAADSSGSYSPPESAASSAPTSPTTPAAEPPNDLKPPQEPSAADEPAEAYRPAYSNPVKRRYRVGVVIKSGKNPIADVLANIPIPQSWPEQEVQMFKDEVPGNFEVQEIEQLEGLQRMILHGRSIEAKQKVVALVTYTVTTRRIDLPPDTSIFRLPDPKAKELKGFLMTSTGINFRNKKLRKQAETLVSGASTDWDKVKAIYDWVRANVNLLPENENARQLGAQAAFIKRQGYNEDVVGLFIAMCRSAKIPARMVFADGVTDAEFMLDDAVGNHHWFPCDVAGLEAFGKTVEPKLILQKGDSIKVPGEKGRRKYVPETGKCTGYKNAPVKPQMIWVRGEISLEDK